MCNSDNGFIEFKRVAMYLEGLRTQLIVRAEDLNDIATQARAAVAPLITTVQEITSAATRHVEAANKLGIQVTQIFTPYFTSENINKIKETTQAFHDGFIRIDKESRNFVHKCVESGWYLTPDDMALRDLMTQVDINDFMSTWVEEHLAEIEERLCSAYPHRSNIIRAALQAHREGKYELSIPTIFPQVEGICIEKLQKYIPFTWKNGSHIKDMRTISPAFSHYFFDPLFDDKYSNAKTDQAPLGALNRHLVLHGKSTDYPTRVNSLKVISLLSSIDWLVSEYTKYLTKKQNQPE